MDETTWKDRRVAEAMEAFEPLKIDHDIQTIFVDRYRIEALPVLLILDPEGQELTRVLGMQSTEEVLALMEDVREGFPAFQEAMAKDDDFESHCRAAEYLLEIGNYERATDVARQALREARDAEDAEKAPIELALGEAQLGAGDARRACKSFALARDHAAGDDELVGRALRGLVLAERERGREEEAARALELLRERFPELAEGL
jgi:tetratricopeptide (TPR) repeat protein